MELPNTIRRVLEQVDLHQDQFVSTLAKAVAIPSVSQQKEYRPQTIQVVDYFKQLLESRGVEVHLCDLGEEKCQDGSEIPLPPVITATFGHDPSKKTLCVYGHLDVQPALVSDGWNTDPFTLTESGGKLYGRGATDDKGPVLAWINMIDAFQAASVPLPVNLKFILEAMEESGSTGLHQLVRAKKDCFLSNVDYFCISDSYWLGTSRPCLTYGLRGNVYFCVSIRGARKDLHSGVYGGAVHEAMNDLVHLLAKLTDAQGNILVPGVMDQVRPMSSEEKATLESLDFDVSAFCSEVGANRLRFEDKVNILAHRWRFPALSIHGIEGAFHGPGSKTVIPSEVVGKFSIRLVPDQNPEDISNKVYQYLEQEFAKLNTPNSMNISNPKKSSPWIGDISENNFVAGKMAIKNVFGVEPDLTREGGSIPVTLTFEQQTGKSVLLLPIGAADDGAHSQNEKIDRTNYLNGSKVFAAYIHFLSVL